MKRRSLLYFAFLICLKSFGQFNDTVNYHLNLTSTGMINQATDGKAYNLNNNIKLGVSKKSIFVNSSAGWVYGKQSNNNTTNLTNNDFSAVTDFNLYKSVKNFYYWGLGSYDKSYSLKIDNRAQAGLGIGYHVLNKENLVIVLSDGILYEVNKLYDNPQNEVLRNSFRLKFRFVYKNIIVVDGTDFLQNSLSSEKDYIVKSVTNLSFKLHKLLSLTASVNYNRLNLTEKETLLINFGFALEKYF